MEGKIRRYAAMAACALMGFAVGFVINYGNSENMAEKKFAAGAEKYTELMGIVDEYFIGEEPDMTAVNDAMASAVVTSLGDRWSYYVSAQEYQSYLDNINNAYVGVGITITAAADEEGNLMGYEVTEVVEGGPAEEAGVLAGDILVEVDRTSVADITLTETKNMVKGKEGTTVLLTFLRGEARVELTVERRSFTLIPAEGMMLDGNVGYIIIDNFDAGCCEAVVGLVEELRGQGAESLLFDLRNNPGGLKTELTNLLDYLLPEGTVFHTINYQGEEEIVTSDADCVDMPMSCLVNGSSYSAAEYFACCIQEYEVGKVIGEKTFGKGYYQVGKTLSDGSCVNLSIGKYFTPSGESLIDVGVTPDVELSLDTELARQLALGKLSPEDDPQIQAALNTLK